MCVCMQENKQMQVEGAQKLKSGVANILQFTLKGPTCQYLWSHWHPFYNSSSLSSSSYYLSWQGYLFPIIVIYRRMGECIAEYK